MTQSLTDYKISIKEPKSDNDKKIEGLISFTKTGPNLIANSILNGLPNPFINNQTNLPVENNTGSITWTESRFNHILISDNITSPTDKTVVELLSNSVLINLQNMIISKYGLNISLKYEDTSVNTPIDTASQSSATPSITPVTASTPNGEYTFDVQIIDTFSHPTIGFLTITGKQDTTFIFNDYGNDELSQEYTEDEYTGEEELPFVLPTSDIAAFDVEFDKILNGNSGDIETPPGDDSTNSPVYSGNIKTNMKLIADAAKVVGLKSKKAIYSMIAVASGESGLVPQSEGHVYRYANLKNVFPKLTTDQLTRATKSGISKKEFFSIVYGEYDPKRVANRSVKDGGMYYGRGFIQLTGYGNYKKYNDLLKKYFPSENVDIVINPDKVNDARICAKLVALYFLERVNVDQNSNSYFSRSLTAIGKDANGGYAKKTRTYNGLFNSKDQSFIA